MLLLSCARRGSCNKPNLITFGIQLICTDALRLGGGGGGGGGGIDWARTMTNQRPDNSYMRDQS